MAESLVMIQFKSIYVLLPVTEFKKPKLQTSGKQCDQAQVKTEVKSITSAPMETDIPSAPLPLRTHLQARAPPAACLQGQPMSRENLLNEPSGHF